MSDLYSSLMVVLNMKGEPSAVAQARALSVARPLTSLCTAKDAWKVMEHKPAGGSIAASERVSFIH